MVALRYVRFHPAHGACDHCGAALKQGAVELSDGLRYGRLCAARAMGQPRESSRMRAQVERLIREAQAAADEAAGRALVAGRASWLWLAQGYGGNAGWGMTTAWRLPGGREILEVRDEQTARVLRANAPSAFLGSVPRSGAFFFALTTTEASALQLGALRWSTARGDTWHTGIGWVAP